MNLLASDAAVDSGIPEPVWDRIARHPARLLMLDFDGTLAPFSRERGRVQILPEALAAIERLVAGRIARVAVVSGRPVEELRERFEGLGLHLVGEHGWEEVHPDGMTAARSPSRTVRARLRIAAGVAAAMGLSARIERKHTAIVLHLRDCHDRGVLRAAARLEILWSALRLGGGLRLDRGDGGLELRAAGRGKDTAALSLLRAGAPGTLPVFLGDDTTDEDAFRVLRPLGITIRVGATERPTLAEWRLGSPESVARFLAGWVERFGRPR